MHINSCIQNYLVESDYDSDDLYLLISKPKCRCSTPQIIFPRKYIFYQTEQKTSNIFTSSIKLLTESEVPDEKLRNCLNSRVEYMQYLNNSNFVLDFSKNNYPSSYLSNNLFNKTFYTPFPFIKMSKKLRYNTSYDICFYGAKNKRRKEIIDLLKKKV